MKNMQSILCFGDSNTYGLSPENGKRYAEHLRWPSQLKQALGANFQLIEAGQPNRTLVDKPPFDGDVSGVQYLKPYLNAQPLALIIIMLGTNDLKARYHLSATAIGGGLHSLINAIQNHYQQPTQLPQPKLLILCPPEVYAIGQYQRIYAGANEKAKQLGPVFGHIAQQTQCDFFNTQSHIQPCAIEGVHLAPEQHAALAHHLAQHLLTMF